MTTKRVWGRMSPIHGDTSQSIQGEGRGNSRMYLKETHRVNDLREHEKVVLGQKKKATKT